MIEVVADTGPLLHLTEADGFYLFQWVNLHVPPQVIVEMRYHRPDWQITSEIFCEQLEQEYALKSQLWQLAGLLDAGEAEAIALGQQIRVDWLLTDDAAARLFAEQLGLEVHGSLGVVLWAAVHGYLTYSEADGVLSRLAASSLWLSPRILDEARSALHTIFGVEGKSKR